MAGENEVVIYVRSKNDTKAGFSEAKADAEIAGDEAGQGFMSKFGSWLIGGQTKNGGGGIGGIFSTAFSMGPAGIGGLGAVIAAATVELTGLVSGFAAAGAGLGAFGLLALPTLDKIKNAYTGITTAQAAYNAAVAKENLAPSKTNATAVQNAKIALELAQKAAGGGISDAVSGVQQLVASFEKMATAIQPAVLTVFDQALGVANELLPTLGKFAEAAAPAIEKVMTSLSKSINSKAFQDFVNQLVKITPGAITAIGSGIGQVAIAVGHLLTIMSAKDDVNAINIAFKTIAYAIDAVAIVVKGTMLIWDQLSSHIAAFSRAAQRDLANWAQDVDNAVHSVEQFIQSVINWFGTLPGRIMAALSALPGELFSFGSHIIHSLASGIASAAGGVLSAIGGIAGIIASHLPHSPAKMGPLSGEGSPDKAGERISSMLAQGMRRGAANVASASGYMAGAAGAGIHGGAGGGVVFQFPAGGTGLDALFVQWFKQKTMQLGGGGKNSVQVAFGQVH